MLTIYLDNDSNTQLLNVAGSNTQLLNGAGDNGSSQSTRGLNQAVDNGISVNLEVQLASLQEEVVTLREYHTEKEEEEALRQEANVNRKAKEAARGRT